MNKCELCGSSRQLELHHIVPRVCGGDNSEENLILICKRCHALLTPTSLLTKIGINNKRFVSDRDQFKYELYKKIQQGLNEYGGSNLTTVFDIICDAIDNL